MKQTMISEVLFRRLWRSKTPLTENAISKSTKATPTVKTEVSTKYQLPTIITFTCISHSNINYNLEILFIPLGGLVHAPRA